MRWWGFACVVVVVAAAAALCGRLFRESDELEVGVEAEGVANARADWVNETTTSSRVRALRFSANGLTLWAASSNSGVYSSLDRGTTWTRAGPSLPHSSVGAFAIKPGAPNTILAEAVGRVHGSTDGGKTWTFIVRFTELAHTIEFHRAASSDVYLGGGSGMWKSTDSGASWSRQSAGIGSLTVNCIATHPTAPGLVIAGTDGGPFRTTNGGGSWSLQLTGLENLRHSVTTALWIDPASVTTNTGTVLLGSWQGIFRSTDGGRTWASVGGDPGGPAAPVWDFADGSTVAGAHVLAASSSGVYRSDDNGGTWTRTLASPATAVTASSSTAVVSGRDFDVRKSIDGGLTWSRVTGVGQLDARRLSADAASDGEVYGILTSDTGESVVMRRAGGVWTRLTLPQPYSFRPNPREVCASPTTPGTVFVAVDGGDSSILRSTDSGAVWERSTLSSLRNFVVDGLALNPSDGEVGLLAASPELDSYPTSQAFLRTSNPGAWSEVAIPELDPNIGHAGGCAIRGGPSPT